MMMRRLWRGLRTTFGRPGLDDEIRRELDLHVEMEIEHHVRAGLGREEARRRALRDFGGLGRIREEVRDERGMTFWDSLAQDVRFGIRTLRRSPGYTFAAIATLGLGIGANSAIFSVIDGVLLKPLPFRDGHRLVLVQQSAPGSNVTNAFVGIPELYAYRQRLHTVTDLVEYHQMNFVLLNQGEPDRVDTGVVSTNFFDVLGVKPLYGRTFVASEAVLDSPPVLVLSHGYWMQKFGGDPSVVGRVLQMNNKAHTVIGVLPDYPQYPAANDVYMPTSACPFRANSERNLPAGYRSFAALNVFGRLAPGATVEQASSELAAVAASFEHDHPADYTRAKGLTGHASMLQQALVTGARPMLIALGGATLLVLLIACANVANLALARTVRRERELAVRTVLGAGRRRLVRQLLTESLIVALAGGALGLLLASLSMNLLVAFVGRFTERTGQISMDAGVLAFTAAISIVTGVIFGAAPALAARRDLAQSIRSTGAQAGEPVRRRRLRSSLVVAQVAVSFVLLVGAALLLESVHRLSSVQLGYRTDHVMTAAIFGNFTRLTSANAASVQMEILDRLRASPGVQAAAITGSVPLSNIVPGRQTVRLEGAGGAADRSTAVDPNVASEGYFETLDVPVLEGRTFRASDGADGERVAVINASMAQLWQGVDPVGRRFQIPANGPGDPPWVSVIGVVGDFRLYGADTEIVPMYYTPFTQAGFAGGRLLVRTAGNPFDLVPAIKAAVHGVDPQIPVEELLTLEELKNGRLASPRLTATLLSVFAGIALLISLAGIAGVVGTTVSQRTREFGLRMALGAERASVLRLVLSQGLVLVGLGVVLGLGGAWLFGRLIRQYLFATTPTDLTAYGAVALLFLAAALLASFGPARRATSIDPLAALRTE
jgi:putative ABC transport system permease protein